jgi:hypothetical protein
MFSVWSVPRLHKEGSGVKSELAGEQSVSQLEGCCGSVVVSCCCEKLVTETGDSSGTRRKGRPSLEGLISND